MQISYKSKSEDYYKNCRRDIIPLLPDKVDSIFEIGCGSGDTLAYLKASKKCKWAGGIEIFPKAAKLAMKKNLNIVLRGNIEDARLPFKLASMDIILFLDVLEHLSDPWGAIKKITKYLKPDGIIICSIPNVRNYKVIFSLLFLGKWDYVENGILDKTHLRFFTKKTAIDLVGSSGMKVTNIVPLIYGKNIIANSLTLNIFQSFFTYQYLIKATKK